MEFLENKYKKWYDSIIETSKSRTTEGYIERHHIVPRSLGGTDDISNLAILTAREHFICHLFLTKFTTGYDKKLMNFALGKFIQNSPLQHRTFNSWEYSKIRESISVARTGQKHSNETRKKMSEKAKGRTPWNKGKTIGPCTDERKKILSNFWKGKPKSEIHAKNIRKGKLGHTSGMTGKKHSMETKIKISERQKGPRGPQKRFNDCPTCIEKNVTARHIKFCKNNMEN